ncbi:hypothetical protein SAMN04488069_1343 [Hymenobacter psychrophilus]|uniref:Uncharacterized protein n=1 Tax=Hymenobacter psychrophilus TaxID=651662 RepID=A0A1H3PIE4_9BACT|nr:hypothetical protein SAMN04488069_1343 [Hymenobacter psychrophilus]
MISTPLAPYSLLLSYGHGPSLDDWIFTIILLWIPQLLWTGLAALVLWVALIRLRYHWLRWVLVFVPYAMIGLVLWDTWTGEFSGNSQDYILSKLSSERFQRDWAPILLTVPGMLLWHLKLWRKQARLRAQELAAQTPPASPG